MTASTTSTVYIHVIEDVINKVRDEFVNNSGPGEDVLKELQGVIDSFSSKFYRLKLFSLIPFGFLLGFS